MALWKITNNRPKKIPETQISRENLLEENLEDWIANDASILGEPLLIIGRQVMIPDVKDRLDLLAVDPQGASVIIELKRGHLKDPVDIQSLRYASYISKWQFEDFENVARNFFKKVGDPEFNFNGLYEAFCEDAGTVEVPDLNESQRIIIVGSTVRDKLASVALWLRKQGIDIKLVEVQAYKEGESVLIEPTVIVPLQVGRGSEVGKPKSEGIPWTADGRSWHLEKRCSPKTKDILLSLDKLIQDTLVVDGPKWNQKYYVAYRVNSYNWLCVITRAKFLLLDINVKAGAFNGDELAKQLNIVKFDTEDLLSEKLGLPSSVLIKNRNENTDRIRFRVKDDFDLSSTPFLQFLEKAYKECPE
jgi:hypothetical protein